MFMLSLAGHALQKGDTNLIGIFLLLTRNFLFFRYCLNKQLLELARNGQKNGYRVLLGQTAAIGTLAMGNVIDGQGQTIETL